MFTISDIRNIAIQIEQNGEKSYRRAADAASDPEIAHVFSSMADDEKRHAEWFEAIESEKVLTEEQKEMEAVGKTLLQEMVKDKTFSLKKGELDIVENMEEVLLKSQGFEEDTILFYEMLSGFVDEGETMVQLKQIIEEERTHLSNLKEMVDKVLSQPC